MSDEASCGRSCCRPPRKGHPNHLTGAGAGHVPVSRASQDRTRLLDAARSASAGWSRALALVLTVLLG
jgi:hypothetical protein